MVLKRSLFSWVLRSHRGLQALLFAMIVMTIFFRVFPLEMQKRIVNQAIELKKIDLLLWYCGFYIAAVVLAGVMKYAINVLQGYIGQNILLRMRKELYDHILRLPLPFFRRTPPGMVISSLTSELSAVGDFLGGAIAVPVINILTLLTFAGYMFYLNPLLALLSVSIYPVEIFLIPIMQRRLNQLNTQRVDIMRTVSNLVGETISGMHEIHANGSYALETHRFSRHVDTLFSLRNRMNLLRFGIKFVSNFFQSLGPFILFLVGGYLSIKGRLDLGALVAFLSAYEKLYDPWKELMDYYQDYQDSRVRYYRVMSYFDAEPEFTSAPEDREPYNLEGHIQVRDLSYSVDENIRLLDRVSMDIQPGEQMALVGFSGSGKSTLGMVLGQIYSYQAGHVLMDGRELKGLTKLDVIENVGYVAQHPFIFDGALLDNLLYGCRSIMKTNSSGGDGAAVRSHCREAPGRTEILDVISRVGLSDDVLRLALGTTISRGHSEGVVEKLIRVRKLFFEKWGEELETYVEFFDESRYLHYSSIMVNIAFGAPNREDYRVDTLAGAKWFQGFLKENGLRDMLLELGREIAHRTVSLLRDMPEDPFFFRYSPILPEEFEYYAELVKKTEKAERYRLSGKEEEKVLLLALRFIPARHKMAMLAPQLEEAVFSSRSRFMKRMSGEDPEAYTFYRKTEYLYNQTILDNLIFGRSKTGQPEAMEEVQNRVMELIVQENLLDDIMEIGLQFQVGSKGDRLSGGQRQKVALARTLLKNPCILILDEATASLDNASHARIQNLLGTEMRGKCTLISIVHRLDTVQAYDRIAVMRAGKIVEIGSYDELIARKGLFHELVNQ